MGAINCYHEGANQMFKNWSVVVRHPRVCRCLFDQTITGRYKQEGLR